MKRSSLRSAVEIDHYVDGADCFIVLVSPSANDAVEKFRDSILDNEIARFKSFAPELVVIDGNLSNNNVKSVRNAKHPFWIKERANCILIVRIPLSQLFSVFWCEIVSIKPTNANIFNF